MLLPNSAVVADGCATAGRELQILTPRGPIDVPITTANAGM
jgi:hypothetical protein